MHYLQILLVVWAIANDALASSTADRSDDVVASRDNVYREMSPESESTPRHRSEAPLAVDAPADLANAFQSGPPVTTSTRRFNRSDCRPLVYVLMTLRR